jgi:hypothetical protein
MVLRQATVMMLQQLRVATTSEGERVAGSRVGMCRLGAWCTACDLCLCPLLLVLLLAVLLQQQRQWVGRRQLQLLPAPVRKHMARCSGFGHGQRHWAGKYGSTQLHQLFDGDALCRSVAYYGGACMSKQSFRPGSISRENVAYANVQSI